MEEATGRGTGGIDGGEVNRRSGWTEGELGEWEEARGGRIGKGRQRRRGGGVACIEDEGRGEKKKMGKVSE